MGDTATIHCNVGGVPLPEISWFRQDSNMPNGRTETIDGGLKIKDSRPEDEGLYYCQVCTYDTCGRPLVLNMHNNAEKGLSITMLYFFLFFREIMNLVALEPVLASQFIVSKPTFHF